MQSVEDPGRSRAGRRLRRGLALASCLVTLAAAPARAELRVVTTTPALADLTRQVGGSAVRVEALMRGPENPHNVVPKPSFVVKLRRADLFVHLGLDAEPWVPSLLRGARREHLLPAGAGNIDVSAGIALAEVPARAQLSRAFGDIHVYGNPHYLLDPLNGIVVATTIGEALTRADPTHADTFRANLERLSARLRALTDRLVTRMRPFEGTAIVTYHRTWPYFLRRFALEKIDEVEPKPGIAPGPRHVLGVAARMRERGAKLVIVETFSNLAVAERVAGRAEGKAVVLAQEVRSVAGVDSYEQLFEYNVGVLVEALGDHAPPAAGTISPAASR